MQYTRRAPVPTHRTGGQIETGACERQPVGRGAQWPLRERAQRVARGDQTARGTPCHDGRGGQGGRRPPLTCWWRQQMAWGRCSPREDRTHHLPQTAQVSYSTGDRAPPPPPPPRTATKQRGADLRATPPPDRQSGKKTAAVAPRDDSGGCGAHAAGRLRRRRRPWPAARTARAPHTRRLTRPSTQPRATAAATAATRTWGRGQENGDTTPGSGSR